MQSFGVPMPFPTVLVVAHRFAERERTTLRWEDDVWTEPYLRSEQCRYSLRLLGRVN